MFWVSRKKNKEVSEMIECFESDLYKSRENKTKKKLFTEDLCSHYEFILAILDSFLHFTISYIS